MLRAADFCDNCTKIISDQSFSNVTLRKTGVRVGETWDDRIECRLWGAHLPHIAGITRYSRFGVQSVALSGGYEDDEDQGDWFLYTGRFDNLTTNHSSTVFFCLVTDMLHYIKMYIK
jgi:hypothetical protein